jgi:hypothetical protein
MKIGRPFENQGRIKTKGVLKKDPQENGPG